jgi:hypothetical protein
MYESAQLSVRPVSLSFAGANVDDLQVLISTSAQFLVIIRLLLLKLAFLLDAFSLYPVLNEVDFSGNDITTEVRPLSNYWQHFFL